MYAIDVSTGKMVWTFDTEHPISATSTISESGTIYLANNVGEVFAVDSSARVKWYFNAQSPISGGLLLQGGSLIFGTEGKTIIAIADSSSAVGKLSKSLSLSSNIWGTYQGNNRRTGVQGTIVTKVASKGNTLPTEFELSQNYPNPFNPSTTIRYGLPQKSQVSLKVFNTLGQLVATLVNGEQEVGYHEVRFDGSNLASGVYFYRLQAGTYVETRKLLLLR
jgi:hypothetical protein